jgi:phage gpG-like protein
MDDPYSLKFKVEDNTDLAAEELAKRIGMCLYKMGENSVTHTVDYMSKPDFTGKDIVDTGRLRASISFATVKERSGPNGAMASETDALTQQPPSEKSVIVGTNVEYANYVELGTSKQPARHFLLNGIYDSMTETNEDLKSIMKGAQR